MLGDSGSVQTPKGLNQLAKTGLNLGFYIVNFKGGRNESFMYGSDDKTLWYDYDLVSAYTTVMAMMGHPAYNYHRNLAEDDLKSMTESDILYSFLIIQCDFEFPNTVKYPSIGCFIDETTTVYPLKGSAFLTGAEYLLARSQGCKLDIKSINHIPFAKDVYPFKKTIK